MVARESQIISQRVEESMLAQFVEALITSQDELSQVADVAEWSDRLLETCRSQQHPVQPEHRIANRITTIDADRGIRRMAV